MDGQRAEQRVSSQSLQHILRSVYEGRLLLPRTESAPWAGEQRLRVLESIYRGLPIGSVVVLRTTADLASQQTLGGTPLQLPRQEGKVPRDYVVDGIELVTTLFQELGAAFQHDAPQARPRPGQAAAEHGSSVVFDVRTRTFRLRRAEEDARETEFLLSELFDAVRQQAFSGRVRRLPEGERLANQVAYLADAFFDYSVPLIRVVSDDVQGVLASLSISRSAPSLVMDPAVAQAERYSRQVTADIEGKTLIPSRGITTTGSAMATGKRVVRFFVSYAEVDRPRVEALVKELSTLFTTTSAHYELHSWMDREVPMGERWKERIAAAIEDCDLGLMMISPELLVSMGTPDNPKSKPVLSVGHDASAHALYVEIERRLDALFLLAAPGSSEAHVPVPEATLHVQRNRGQPFLLKDLEQLESQRHALAAQAQGRDALEELLAWAKNAHAPPFFALLGEYGIGKTTTLKELTLQLLKERQFDPRLPLPIYVDLRNYIPETRDTVPTIEQLLASLIQRSWKARDRISPEDVLRLVRQEGAIILFDGLDEKIVHMPPDRARDFIRTLWSVLPDAARSRDPLPEGKLRGKLLISCRSHYFRDVWSQNMMLAGEDREGFDRGQFPALCLLPFTEEQIQAYLASLLSSEEKGAGAFELIASIHDLRDLAQRPYLLTLISGHLGELEKVRARGDKVNAARLYDIIVRSWLGRDEGKHQLDPVHKRRLMEELAAALWREETRQWEADRLEDWLDTYLEANPSLAKAYENKDRTVLKEDLRTATFILRPTSEEKDFRFAHSSLQEYFLAAYLARALVEGRQEKWDVKTLSRETLDFLGEILEFEPQQSAALRSLEALLGGEALRAAVLAFDYWLRAIQKELPVPTPTRVKLAGANLEGWHIRGRGPTQPLVLRGADLSGAWLNRARVEYVDLTEANLEGMQARQALFLKVSAAKANAQGADFRGLQWREGSLAHARLQGAQLSGCQWIQVDLLGATLPKGWEHQAIAVGNALHLPLVAGTSSLEALSGHSSWVTACAWSPDGARLLSGSFDNSLKVWDVSSGQCLLTLLGHSSRVRACAWSPDGSRLLSASFDNSLKVWDASSGQCLLTLLGHSSSVLACAWSSDGTRLLSGSGDNSLKVWDASSGQCLLTLLGHSSSVLACAWSPDGSRLLSASLDNSLKVWDVSSGQCLLTLLGHSSSVQACAWSPDGSRLLSASLDNSLKVWDASSGQCLLTLLGHSSSVLACAWSSDGTRLLSASFDNSLKVWDASSGQCLLTLLGHSSSVLACAWSSDGTRLLSGSLDNSLKVWDVSSGQCLLTLLGHSSSVLACAWSPDGSRLLSASFDNSLKVWDASSGQCLLTLLGHSSSVQACAWSPDGSRLLSASGDNSLKVWDVSSGQCLLTLLGHSSSVQACAWSPDGSRLLSASLDNSLKVWDVSSGQCLLTLLGHSSRVRACAWSPDGSRLLSASFDNSLKVWDASSGQCLLTLLGHSDSVLACAWSPDGARLLSGSDDKSLKVWDASSGQCLLTLLGHSSSVQACAWSPDGARLLSGSDDKSLKVWDASSGQCLLALQGHSSSVTACSWSPDGARLLSASDDNSLKVWDASSGQCTWTGYHLPERQTASLHEAAGHFLHASPEAWRWFGWRSTDPITGQLRILPAEFFGPLPA